MAVMAPSLAFHVFDDFFFMKLLLIFLHVPDIVVPQILPMRSNMWRL